MSNYIISCESTVDMNQAWAERRDIKIAFFHYYLNEKEYLDDFFQSIRPHELYQRMLAGEPTRTSQVNAEEYELIFRAAMQEGKDVLHIALSSGISGTVNSARIAAEQMREEFPERRIEVIDSLGATSGYGLLVDMAADLRDQGKSFEEVYSEIESKKLTIQSWIMPMDLTFLIRGGRVSKTAGMVGQILNICPILKIARDGSLKPVEKIRGKKKAIERLAQKAEELSEGGFDYSGKFFISQSDCEEEAEKLRSMLRERFPKVKDIEIFPIGTTIGCHTGPGTLVLFFQGQERD